MIQLLRKMWFRYDEDHDGQFEASRKRYQYSHLGAGGSGKRERQELLINIVSGQEVLTYTSHLGIPVTIGCENSQLETRVSKNTDYYSLLYNTQL